ncbi:MAG: SAM-dependent methyltransferase, partial [Gammaproteobacteria bacterium]|nr:SAM-dependent methyltransferase [Gammaproteobacteria bacterium]
HAADESGPDWAALARAADTLVAYMAVGRLQEVCSALLAAGLPADHPALLVENGTTASERVLRGSLESLPERARAAGAVSPALLIVGAVAGLATVRDSHHGGGTEHAWLPTAAPGLVP